MYKRSVYVCHHTFFPKVAPPPPRWSPFNNFWKIYRGTRSEGVILGRLKIHKSSQFSELIKRFWSTPIPANSVSLYYSTLFYIKEPVNFDLKFSPIRPSYGLVKQLLFSSPSWSYVWSDSALRRKFRRTHNFSMKTFLL